MTQQELGQYLKQQRQECGLTQDQLAKGLGYKSPQFVSNWERGTCYPALETMPQIADALQISKKSLATMLVRVIATQTLENMHANYKLKVELK